MDKLTTHIQEKVTSSMLFANDITLVDESKNNVNAKLERWQGALESRGFKLSNTKAKYMNCNFGGDVQRDVTPMRIEAQQIPQGVSFRYLGFIISKDARLRKMSNIG